MVGLRISAQDEGQADADEFLQDRLPPGWGTLRPRRSVAGGAGPRKAESHRQDGDATRIEKNLFTDPHPLPQTHATGVLEGNSRGVHSTTWSLADNQDRGLWVDLEDRAWSQREV